MHAAFRRSRFSLWPRKLITRLFVILLVGLVLAHTLSFVLLFNERAASSKSLMLGDLEHDVATAVAILDRLPAEERAAWLPRLSTEYRRYSLGEGKKDRPLATTSARAAAAAIDRGLGGEYPADIGSMPDDGNEVQARVRLSDGSLVTFFMEPKSMPLATWLPIVFFVQLTLLIACTWFAVRVAVRPLTQLADAADALDPNIKNPRLSEKGPAEVAYAAKAFNAMQDRISAYLAERLQILAAISHDLQTPITRMKLRTELGADFEDREKFVQDLGEMERLVREGVTYARSIHGDTEKPQRIDLDAFLDSLVCDYQDTGKDVTLSGGHSLPVETRPHALRRILSNLIDNALKFAGAAEVLVSARDELSISIYILDRGPGIPAEERDAVLQPFYRLEGSRNRDSGGTGLGLAIAYQLAQAIGGKLVLDGREGGGLSIEIRLPAKG